MAIGHKIPTKLVNIPGFNVYKKDRPSHDGGVFIKDTSPHTYCPDLPILLILKWFGLR